MAAYNKTNLSQYSKGEKYEIDAKHCWEEGYSASDFWQEETRDLCKYAMLLIGNKHEQFMPLLTFMTMETFDRLGVQNLIINFSLVGNVDNFNFYEHTTKLVLAMSEMIIKKFEEDYESVIISEAGARGWNELWRIMKPLREDDHLGEMIDYMRLTPTRAAEIGCLAVNKLTSHGVPILSSSYY